MKHLTVLHGIGSGDWIRTGDTSGMNRMLWPTELRRQMLSLRARITITDPSSFVNTFSQKFLQRNAKGPFFLFVRKFRKPDHLKKTPQVLACGVLVHIA